MRGTNPRTYALFAHCFTFSKDFIAACLEQGADKVYAAASHGLFIGAADKLFTGDELEQVIVTEHASTQ